MTVYDYYIVSKVLTIKIYEQFPLDYALPDIMFHVKTCSCTLILNNNLSSAKIVECFAHEPI